MAVATDSTTAPARPLLPLRGPDGRFGPRAELPPEPLLQPATITDVRRELEALIVAAEIEAAERQARDARALHMRWQAKSALEWGFVFLNAFHLGSAALDIIDDTIADMDAEEAPDEDREPYLAGFASPLGLDLEDDSEENEGTALESHGRGFVRCGPDDAEEDDPAEDGDEDENYREPWPAQRADRCGGLHV